VLTAAHVIGEPNRNARVTLHDGRRANAKTLGVFRTGDAGLVKITRQPEDFGLKEWPHATMGTSNKLEPGQWCLATGHPGGFQTKRTPVVRLGRILSVDRNKETITTDCTLIGGDSGGPLFDMDGNVIAIHSRIGSSLTLNLHVPVKTYRDSWDRLVASEAWGHPPGSRPFIGVQGDPEADNARVARVFDGTPAAEAGIQEGDVIIRFAGKRVTTFESLKSKVETLQPGTKVRIEIERDSRTLVLSLTIGLRQ
jgi:serine protease Do